MQSLLTMRGSGRCVARLLTVAGLCIATGLAVAQDRGDRKEAPAITNSGLDTVLIARTDSPRQTLQSWLEVTGELDNRFREYRQNQTRANFEKIFKLAPALFTHLDLSELPAATRGETAAAASYALFDILARVELPIPSRVPDADGFDETSVATWRIPRTPITIARMEEGPRAGEFLFSAKTVAIAPNFLERIRHLPVKRGDRAESWTDTLPQLHGPMIPAALVEALPKFLHMQVLDTALWKIGLSVVAFVIAAMILVLYHLRVGRRRSDDRLGVLLRQALTPLGAIAFSLMLAPFLNREINVAGAFAWLTDSTLSVIRYLAIAWLVWIVLLAVFEWMILSPRIDDESPKAGLMRLGARVIGSIAVLLVLAKGAHDLGLPVLGLLAGLGFGGLAVALAIRPTLENLVAGVILFVDKPVEVGDFCTFGARIGVVESIGIRTTKVRALDRTLISIPNATFADMELVNWARCDKMLVLTQIGLRYETDPDQLRHLLASLREMLYAHPRIDRSTVRVRFVGYGASSLDVQIRVYALTQEWNEFYAIREDVYLRVNQIVAESGTSFAFPSQTLYFGRDGGLDQKLSEAAKEEVAAWRRTGKLPFPDPAAARVDDLAGTLDYPPRGSVEQHRPDAGEAQEVERLSESSPPEQPEDEDRTEKS